MSKSTEGLKEVDLKSFYLDNYDGSDLQKINRNNPLPHKCTSDGQEYFYYNADLSGLMWMQGEDGKLKYHEFVDFYKNGFADGLNHLKKKEGIKRKDFYNANKIEGLKKVFHRFLFTRDFLRNYKGLQDLENKIPLIWTEKRIYNEGYYNGLLHSILTLCNDLNIEILNGLKENKKKAGRNKDKVLSVEQYLLVSHDNKQVFLDKLKQGFEKKTKKEFCYFILGLNQLELLNMENEQNVFETFKKYFGGDCGSYSNFNTHKSLNDKKLLDSTKDKIKTIKFSNAIM